MKIAAKLMLKKQDNKPCPSCKDTQTLIKDEQFRVKVLSSSKNVPPERLPPTIDTANFHNRRVFHQVQAWLGNSLQPTEWGWVLEKTPTGKPILKPTRMAQEAAPKSLLIYRLMQL